MKPIVLLSLAVSLFVLPLSAADPCPVCGGELTTVGKVKDDPSKPNKNLWVWRRSSGLQLFDENSPICKRCWFVSNSDSPAWWMRSCEQPESFHIPLSQAIRKFPVPPGFASYDQLFIDGKRTDSLFFMCKNSTEMIAKFRGFCTKHQLSISVVEFSEDVGIWVEAPEAQQAGAGQPATKPAEKVPAKDQSSPPTPKSGPR
jgi:hypothetical protein